MELTLRDRITRPDLRDLAENEGPHRVSLLMPTHRKGPEIQQDPIRFGNLMNRAINALHDLGQPEGDLELRLEDLASVEGDDRFWEHQSDGLAVYFDGEGERAVLYRLPMDLDEIVVVGRHFHLKPLLLGETPMQLFYIAVVSKDEFHLLECRRDRWTEVEAESFPKSEWEAVQKYLAYATGPQMHSTRTAGSAGHSKRSQWSGPDHTATFHGHGAGEDDEKIRIREYFEAIDRAVDRVICDDCAPVIFAGVDYLFPIFQDAVKSLTVLDEHIHGNFDKIRADYNDLHEKAVRIVDERFDDTTRGVLERYGDAAGHDMASTDVREIVQGAYDGRVDTLLIDPTKCAWGTFSGRDRTVALDDEPGPGREDLVNLAGLYTHLRDGAVYAFEGDRMPNGKAAAAIWRYAAKS